MPSFISTRLAACLLTVSLSLASVRAETIQLQEKPWEQLVNHDVGSEGEVALSIRPKAWLHGETPNWIIHYRRITEAKRVALEIDFHLNFVAKFLGAKADQLSHKANVFVFEDEKDWKEFMSKVTAFSTVSAWAASFAHGEDLFLNVREGNTGMFNSGTLAHETTHAVVARIYRGKGCPLWLNEGFAEEMSGRSVGARMGQFNQRMLQRLQTATLTPDQLTAMTAYPSDGPAVWQLYQSAEKLVRFLLTDAPADRFPKLFEALVEGDDLPTAISKFYADKYPTYEAFKERYARLSR